VTSEYHSHSWTCLYLFHSLLHQVRAEVISYLQAVLGGLTNEKRAFIAGLGALLATEGGGGGRGWLQDPSPHVASLCAEHFSLGDAQVTIGSPQAACTRWAPPDRPWVFHRLHAARGVRAREGVGGVKTCLGKT